MDFLISMINMATQEKNIAKHDHQEWGISATQVMIHHWMPKSRNGKIPIRATIGTSMIGEATELQNPSHLHSIWWLKRWIFYSQ
jgi:hypothetical protein